MDREMDASLSSRAGYARQKPLTAAGIYVPNRSMWTASNFAFFRSGLSGRLRGW
jgi:hypothetical protein